MPSSVLFHASESEELRGQQAVEHGRFLIEEYGCTNCHATDSPSLEARRGPDLTGVGSRARARPAIDSGQVTQPRGIADLTLLSQRELVIRLGVGEDGPPVVCPTRQVRVGITAQSLPRKGLELGHVLEGFQVIG